MKRFRMVPLSALKSPAAATLALGAEGAYGLDACADGEWVLFADAEALRAERDAWKALAEARERLITAFYRGADRVPACQGIDAALAELRRLGIEP